MTVSFGSGQTNGLPILVTAITQGTRQTLHTFPAGSATPERVKVEVQNVGVIPYTLFVAFEDSGATLLRLFTATIPVGGCLTPIFSPTPETADQELVANGSSTLKVWADTASVLCVYARVDNQSSVVATVCQNMSSGLVAAVQAANRFALPSPGAGVGTATEVNANQMIARAGIVRNLRTKADAGVGGGATCTIAIRINGVSSALSISYAAADTTTVKSNTASVAVAIGDLITTILTTDNAGAPAANFQTAFEYVGQ